MMKPLVIVAIGLMAGRFAFGQGFYASPYGASGMGGLVGAPVPGAYMGQNYANIGSGQGMLNQCGYPQIGLVDPTDKNELVVAAKRDIRDTAKALATALKDLSAAQIEYNKKKAELQKTLDRSVYPSAEAFLKASAACNEVSDAVREYNVNLSNSDEDIKLRREHEEKIYNALENSSGLKDDNGRLACASALRNTAAPEEYAPKLFCLSQSTAAAKSFIEGSHTLKGKGNTTSQKDCEDAANDADKAYKKYTDAQANVKQARAALTTSEKDIEDARDEARSIQEELDEANAEAGIPASAAGCPYCAAYALQQQNQGPSKASLGIAAGLIAGLSTLSMLETRANFHDIAKMGFVSQPYVGGMINTGISTGLNAGMPFLYNGMYGSSPGGMVMGGYSCAPTMYGSQMGYGGGPFAGGPYGGAYYPGGYGMPGMGPWGVGGMPGMMGGGMPGMMGGGMPGMMGGMPGGMGGMYNPMMAQQMMYLQQQYMDNLRAEQVAMYSIGYGLNNANQQFGFAQSMLSGGGGMGGYMGGGYGGMGGAGMMGMMPSMFGSTFAGPGMAGPCGGGGGSLFGPTLNICGGSTLGGGFMPNFSNAAYGAPFGMGAFSSPSGMFPGSSFGAPMGNSFNLGVGGTIPR